MTWSGLLKVVTWIGVETWPGLGLGQLSRNLVLMSRPGPSAVGLFGVAT